MKQHVVQLTGIAFKSCLTLPPPLRHSSIQVSNSHLFRELHTGLSRGHWMITHGFIYQRDSMGSMFIESRIPFNTIEQIQRFGKPVPY